MDIQDIEKSVKRSRTVVLCIFMLTIITYLLWFFLIQKQELSTDASLWGSFGDFVGGILNPLIAYSAFYWLTVSVLIQKRELADTKKALIESSEAQKEQVAFSRISAKVEVLKLQLNQINMELDVQLTYRTGLINNGMVKGQFVRVFNLVGKPVDPTYEFTSCNENIGKLKTQQLLLIKQIGEIVDGELKI